MNQARLAIKYLKNRRHYPTKMKKKEVEHLGPMLEASEVFAVLEMLENDSFEQFLSDTKEKYGADMLKE